MNDTDQKKEDEVLKRMLASKPKPHKPKPPDVSGTEKGRGGAAHHGLGRR
jgi:hypothetical protein